MRKYLAASLLLALITQSFLAPIASASTDTGNEDPLAEAGLDQTAERDTTVHLDATGSHDPDGDVTSTHWILKRPNGTTTTPDCATCARTQFVPHSTGTFAATVRVTDDDGATASDTMYVTVTPGDPPTVQIDGPRGTTSGTTVTYTAAATAGTADLTTLTWYVDGDRVETRRIAGASATDTLTYVFRTPGQHTVRVVATDADDQQAATRTPTDIVTPTPKTPPDTTTDTPTPPNPVGTERTPVLHGPQLLTGTVPLSGTYRVTNTTTATVTVDGTPRQTGTTTELTLAPGVHTVFATADNGIARFPDGTTTVIADPAPEIPEVNVSGTSALTISTRATDGLGNLRSLTIEMDDRQVHERTLSVLDYVKDRGSALRATYRTDRLTPGEHTITVTATDGRNQTTTATRTVEIRQPPEIVDSYFVNPHNDDRMAYDRRLPATKYTAHHVLKVELNDFDPEEIGIEASAAVSKVLQVNETPYRTKYEHNVKTQSLTVHTYWASDTPKRGVVSHSLDWSERKLIQKGVESAFWVKPSDPVIRYTIDHEGITEHHSNWGILINASNSFDPDNTELEYAWRDGVRASTFSEKVGKADSFEAASLILRDQNEGRSEEQFGFLDHYVPEFESVREVSSGPYRVDETVTFQVESEVISLTKNSYERKMAIGLRVDGPGTVASWEKERFLLTKGSRRGEAVRYTGIVTVPADAVGKESALVMFNEKGSGWNEVRKPVPDVSGVQRGPGTVRDEKILGVEYLVKRPVYDTIRTTDPREKRALLGDGYLITNEERVGTTYVIEEKQLVEPAVYETERMEFRREGYLEAFLSTNPEWSEGSASREWETRTRTLYEWRDARTGTGSYTGETRRVLVDPAEYKTFRQYEYQRTVEKTGTRTVTRYRTFRSPVEVEETVIKCNSFFGCYEATVTHTEWRTYRIPYTTTETYTYTTTETETYWGFQKRGWSHDFTGATHRLKIDDAEYETQYRYAYEETYRDRVTVYSATRERLVQPAVYDWKTVGSTTDVLEATGFATDPTRRVGSTRPIHEWTLVKPQGSEYVWTSNNSDPDEVVKTRYTIQQTRRITFVDESGAVIESKIVTNTTTQTYPGYRPENR